MVDLEALVPADHRLRKHGIHPRRIGRWAKRLKLDAATLTPQPVQFHPVRLVTTEGGAESSGRPIEIVLHEGLVVRVPPGFLAADLARVLQALSTEAGC
jgi:hypothetical protein